MTEYRVTRPKAYGLTTPGHADDSARQGYYVKARNVKEAEEIIRKRLNLSREEPLNVQEWKPLRK